jgi:hypothetical protein
VYLNFLPFRKRPPPIYLVCQSRSVKVALGQTLQHTAISKKHKNENIKKLKQLPVLECESWKHKLCKVAS